MNKGETTLADVLAHSPVLAAPALPKRPLNSCIHCSSASSCQLHGAKAIRHVSYLIDLRFFLVEVNV